MIAHMIFVNSFITELRRVIPLPFLKIGIVMLFFQSVGIVVSFKTFW